MPALLLPVAEWRRRVGGAVCWILTLIYFLAQPVVAAAGSPPYRYAATTISALGNAVCGPAGFCSPRHVLMNVVFVLVGLLKMAGAWLLRGYWPRSFLATWGLVFVGLSGFGAVLVGLAPADVNFVVHGAGAFLQLPGAAGPLLLGLATVRQRRVERAFSLAAGVIGVAASVLFLTGLTMGLGRGAMERLGFDPLTLWVIVVGIAVIVRGRPVV